MGLIAFIAQAQAGSIDEAWESEGLAPPAPPPEHVRTTTRFVGWGPDRIALATETDPLLVVNLVDDSVLADHPDGIAATLDRWNITRGGAVDVGGADPAWLPNDVQLMMHWQGAQAQLWAVHPEHCGKLVHTSSIGFTPAFTLSHESQPRAAVVLDNGTVVGVHLSGGFPMDAHTEELLGWRAELPATWVTSPDGFLDTCAHTDGDMSTDLVMSGITVRSVPAADHRRPHPYSSYLGVWPEVRESATTVGGLEATRLDWSMPGLEANNTRCSEWEVVRDSAVHSITACFVVSEQGESGREWGDARQARITALVEGLEPTE